MINQEDKKNISYYLENKEYAVYRHVLLQFVILIFSCDALCTNEGIDLSSGRLSVFFTGILLYNLVIYSNVYIWVPRYLMNGKLLKYLFSIFALSLILSVIIILSVELFLNPDVDLARQLFITEWISWLLTFVTSACILVFFSMGVAAFIFFRKWMEENQRVDDLKAATLTTELQFLKSQINPHFLFNMLNNANILIDEDPDMASRILVKLDDLLRYQINDSTRNKVYLSADITFLKDFLDLEKTRRDQFDYTISKQGDVNNVQVAPLLFIPFVENAIKHNLDSSSLSYVHLSFKIEKDKLLFTCKNSIPLKEPVDKKVGGLGLANIKRRLDLLYKDDYQLEQTKSETTYTVNLELKI